MAVLREKSRDKWLARRGSRRRCICLALSFLWLLAGLGVMRVGVSEARAQVVSREYQLKAAFLFNFAQFTEWPTNVIATVTNVVAGTSTATSTNEPLVIGVLGANPFGRTLEEIVEGEVVHRRRVKVEYYRSVEEIQACHILFISQSEDRRLERILVSVKDKPILTVSDLPNAALRGVMIRFVTENNRIRFRINLEAAKAAQLSISSKLLRVAEIVSTGGQP